MEFSFVYSITEHVFGKIKFIYAIGHYLQYEFKSKSYGKGVNKIIFGIYCGGPLSDRWRPFETGFLVDKKYYKSKKYLDAGIYLNYYEVMSADEIELIEIVKRGLLKTFDEINELHIPDFDIISFYKELEDLLIDNEWMNYPEKYKPEIKVYKPENEGKVRFSIKDKLPEDLFWDMINQSKENQNNKIDLQIGNLIQLLSLKDEKEIIGFELTLRDLIRKSYHYHILALLKIIQGYNSDDTFLYIRCELILKGKELFYTAVTNPNLLTEKLINTEFSELLLSVADEALNIKFGKLNDKEMPSELGIEYSDYNVEDYPILGIPWDDKGFEKRYKDLIKLFS